ncbi:MAG: energy transducer TonB [Methylococcales bacterium]|nr:energy transducer TonB [Methylococcales bacterium]
MASLNTPLLSQFPSLKSDSLLVTLFIAAVIHAFIILGISFAAPKPPKINKQIEITLASAPVKKAPKKASYLAQDNQIGAGKTSKKPIPPKQKIPKQGNGNKKKATRQKKQSKSHPKATQKLITQKKSKQQVASKKKSTKHSTKKRARLSAEALQKQIAQLGARIRHAQQSSENTNIKFVSSVSTHKYIASQYMDDWVAKITKIGNDNFPAIAKKNGFSGSLTMDVGIKADGNIYSIHIVKSSGNKKLDEAAKRIVRLGAPYPPLPNALLTELDVLAITRRWKFSNESGATIH